MPEAQESVSVPASAQGLADGLAQLALQLIADHKAAGGSVPAELSTDAVALVTKLPGMIAAAAGIVGDAKATPIGVGEAFALAGFKVARTLTGELSA